MPALLARRALARGGAGATIEVLCDDPLAPIDVPHMCRQEGYDVIEVERNGVVARLVLRRPA
jgi:tRNA 2-thiouridine synthesizing protein A